MMKKIWKALKMCIKKPSRIWKGFSVLFREGPSALLKRAYRMAARENAEAAVHLPPAPDYESWYQKHRVTEQEKKQQRKKIFSYQPKISLVVFNKNASKKCLPAQTYANWELVIAGNAAEALQQADGDYICLLGKEDQLAEDAFFECVKVLNEEPEIDAIYCDDDRILADGVKHESPRMKPDFNIDLLRSTNYIGRYLLLRKSLLVDVITSWKSDGELSEDKNLPEDKMMPENEKLPDYNLVLRLSEKANCICHIPRVLYHRGMEFTENEPSSQKNAAMLSAAELSAVQAHYDRLGLPATVLPGEAAGTIRTEYHWKEQPLISIIIPNKDHIEDLDKCIRSIEERSTYRNYEFIIVENNSTEPETFSYYQKLEEKNDHARVVCYEGNFNYSKINNLGSEYAKGDYFLLLNNDTELIAPDSLAELLGHCMRDDVGIVGARLFFPDDTIQHAGVVIGFGSIAGHAFVNTPRGEGGYENRIVCTQDYSAVTAACMMVKKSVFQQVHGLTPEFEVAFNDVDFCMKVRALGKLVVYNPYAEFYHYEMKSRGVEDSPAKVARFQREVARFAECWPEIVEKGDPYYNPNLALDRPDFALASQKTRKRLYK